MWGIIILIAADAILTYLFKLLTRDMMSDYRFMMSQADPRHEENSEERDEVEAPKSASYDSRCEVTGKSATY